MLGVQLRFRGGASACLLLVFVGLIALPSGCERRDCEEERRHCEGATIVSCVSPCSDVGCHRTWEYEQCAVACVQSDDGFPFCALSSVPDPDCVGANSCSADGPIECQSGYRTAERKCDAGTQCVAASGSAFCALGSAPDPRCASDTSNSSSTCNGKALLSCTLGFAVEDAICPEVCLAGVGCVLSDAPDPSCGTEIARDYCDGDTTLVSCKHGYQVERRECNCLELGRIVGRAYCG